MKILLVISIFAVGKCSGKGMEQSVFTININDILDESLMPASFIMLEGQEDPEESQMESRAVPPEESVLSGLANLTVDDGTFGTAYSTMGFHRKMINSYLCNGFLANQIMSEVMPNSLGITKRVGTSLMMMDSDSPSSKDTMLYDQGSSGYKDWLTKSTTFDDIYRNYLSTGTPANSSDHSNHRSDTSAGTNPRAPDDEYFDEGVITGYAVQQPDPHQMVNNARPGYHASYNPYQQHRQPFAPNNYQQHYQPPAYQPQVAASKNFHQHELLQGEGPNDGSRGDYSYHPSIEYEEKSIGKGIGLKDLFDIALTTLAFLSFGMFILQVIMCITMTKSDANMMIIPGDDGDGEVEVRRRTARSIPHTDGARLREINEIARKVLDSMDAAIFAKQDQGQCSQKMICESNRFSRDLKHTRRFWIAVWNLGISWLTGNMVEAQASSGSILGCLRAMAIGLGGGNCETTYRCSKEYKHKKKNS